MIALGLGIGLHRNAVPPGGTVSAGTVIADDVELQSHLESIGATFVDWNDSIITELGYANYAAANTALYAGEITEEAVTAAWATLNP